MGLFDSGSDDIRAARAQLTQMYNQNRRNLGQAYGEAEEQIQPYDVIGAQPLEELRGVIMGDQDFADAPMYQRYVEAGREPLMQDLANTGSLYSGRRMEGLRDVGQQAFQAYMGNLRDLGKTGYGISSDIASMKTGAAQTMANLGQQYASDMSNIRLAQAGQQGSMRNALIGGGLSAAGSFLGGPGGGMLASSLMGGGNGGGLTGSPMSLPSNNEVPMGFFSMANQ